MEILWLAIQCYFTVGIFFGLFSIFTSTSEGFKEFLRKNGEEEWDWKDDIQATVEAILMWPLILLVLIRER